MDDRDMASDGLSSLRDQAASSVLPVPASIPDAPCRNCAGCGWVCENHADHPWEGLAGGDACCGGAGMPCGACNLEMAAAGFVDRREKAIATWLNELEPSYTGWNDHDEIFDRGWNGALSWVANQVAQGKHWGAAQAIEARRAETQGGSVHESAVGETDAPETQRKEAP